MYDRALVVLSGPAAATNFPTSNYAPEMALFIRHALLVSCVSREKSTLGLYVTEPEAARVYNRALVLVSGPAAATNFPTSNYAPEMALFIRHVPPLAELASTYLPYNQQ